MIAILVEQFIVELGCEPIGPYHDMATRLLQARTTPCDAAIVNLVLHGENAYSIAEALSARGIPFVFATGMPHDGFDGEWADRPYLDKPYEAKDLARVLRRTVAKPCLDIAERKADRSAIVARGALGNSDRIDTTETTGRSEPPTRISGEAD